MSLSLKLLLLALICAIYICCPCTSQQQDQDCYRGDGLCLSICNMSTYYYDESFNDTSCCMSCDLPLLYMNETSGSGSSEYCFPCNESCDYCYGSARNQCHECQGPYMTIIQGLTDGIVTCEDGLIRNTSIDVLECLDECPAGSYLDNSTMECICVEGYYQDGSSCFKCVGYCSLCVNETQAGCLTCSGVIYEGACYGSCPNGTFLSNRTCVSTPSVIELDIMLYIIIAVIGAVGLIVVIIIIITLIFLCCCCCRKSSSKYHKEKRRSKGSVVIASESFKRVVRNVSLRKTKNINSSSSDVYLSDLRNSYDPYRPREPTVLNESEDEETILSVAPSNKRTDSLYVKMAPSVASINYGNSQTNLLPPPHSNAALTRSYPGPPHVNRMEKPNRSNTQPLEEDTDQMYEDLSGNQHQQSMVDDDHQEMYEDLSGNQHQQSMVDDDNQEMYEDLSGNQRLLPAADDENQQDMYVEYSPGQNEEDQGMYEPFSPEKQEVYENFAAHNNVNDDDDEEEPGLYEDVTVSRAPIIPARNIHPARSPAAGHHHHGGQPVPTVRVNKPPPIPSHKDPHRPARKETLDNQYVVIQKSPERLLRQAVKSAAEIDEKVDYINVMRGGGRYRSTSSTDIRDNHDEEDEVYM